MVARNEMPCRNCDKRHPGCHDRCAEYLEVKKRSEERNRQIKEARDIDMMNRRAASKALRRKRRAKI